eukprot:6209519-Pleurochrysis_carterae.AAC.1
MLRSEPNKPMDTVQPASEATGEGAVAYSCYTAPGETFLSEADLKAHYRSELHRFNLKRKACGGMEFHRSSHRSVHVASLARAYARRMDGRIPDAANIHPTLYPRIGSLNSSSIVHNSIRSSSHPSMRPSREIGRLDG